MKKLLPLLFVLFSCQYIEPYIEVVKPTNDKEVQLLANIISNLIIIEANEEEVANIKTTLGLANKNLRVEEGIITLPMIFDIPGLSEKNKKRTELLVNIFEYNIGSIGFKTQEEYKVVLELINSVYNNLER